MKVRAKFAVTKVAELGNYNGSRQEITEPNPASPIPGAYRSTGVPVREITLSAAYDNGIDAENVSFAKAAAASRSCSTIPRSSTSSSRATITTSSSREKKKASCCASAPRVRWR